MRAWREYAELELGFGGKIEFRAEREGEKGSGRRESFAIPVQKLFHTLKRDKKKKEKEANRATDCGKKQLRRHSGYKMNELQRCN